MQLNLKHAVLIFLVILASIWLAGLSRPDRLESILDREELRVATQVGPLTYHPGEYNTSGLDYELAQAFAQYLGVDVSFHPVSPDRIFALLDSKKVDMAAANLLMSAERLAKYRFGPEYMSKSGVLVGRRDERLPGTIEQLHGYRLLVIAGSGFETVLENLQQTDPRLRWEASDVSDIEELLNQVKQSEQTLALVDSNEFSHYGFLYPGLKTAFELMPEQPVGWAFNQGSETDLYLKAVDFFQQLSLNGDLKSLQQRYLAANHKNDYIDSLRFKQRLQERLPDYEHFFREAARRTGLDWRLLAAVSYQESHWDEDAKSFTGVRGLMMLTNQTAERFGVEDRTDPKQSVLAGAAYLRELLGRLPLRIDSPDRLWLALAAYNIGPGHLEDARVITQKQGANPDRWLQVRERLKLLGDEQWYSQTRYGKARGYEPVHFVENVQRYYEVMKRYDRKLVLTDPLEQILTRQIVNSPAL